MASNFSFGPLSGPAPLKNRRRNPIWRFRRFFFVIAVLAGVMLAIVWNFASQVTLTEDDFDDLIATSYICTAEVTVDCNADNATNELSLGGEDRVFVPYEDIPDVLIQAVVAAEDQSYFEHSGIDPMGVARAGYQGVKTAVFGDPGAAVQGGSTITQQYIKLSSGDNARGLDAQAFARKGREIVRAIKYEQELTEQFAAELAETYGDDIPLDLDPKLLAKQDILERYLNRIWFGRRSYGVQAAARNYFDKDVADLTLPEAAYLAGLIRNPSVADYTDNPDEADRRRTVTINQMAEVGYITAVQQDQALADPWTSLTAGVDSKGMGDVVGSSYGTDYFVATVRKRLDEIYPEGEYYRTGIRVYTTLDPNLQRLAHSTVTDRLDPDNWLMPLGALVSLDDQGRVVAMMGGADWNGSANTDAPQVNLATGRDGGGFGFQPGSTMKPIVLAEFIEQGFSPLSFYDRGSIRLSGENYQGYDNTWPNHRTVLHATTYSSNIIYLKMGQEVGIPQVVDMAHRLGITAPLDAVDSLPLGPEVAGPLEMATVYSTFANEGVRLDPVVIDRIEDADGNVLCWYPEAGTDCSGDDPLANANRSGEQAIDPSVARQVNHALRSVVVSGTGKRARLIADDETERLAAGKTGTTDDYQSAWFSGFTCGLTTSVWMGYPGERLPLRDGVQMTQAEYDAHWETLSASEKKQDKNRPLWLMSDFAEPRSSELFGEGYEKIEGGKIPAEMWHDFMMAATAGDEPCDELPTEEPASGLRILGQELETSLVPCLESDLTPPPAEPAGSTTDGGDGGGDSGDGASGMLARSAYAQYPGFQGNSNNNGNNSGGNNGGGNDGGGDSGGGSGAITATTAPCIPIDLDGSTIPEEERVTTTVDTSSTTTETTEPENPDTSETTEPAESTTTESTEPPSTSETTAPEEETTTTKRRGNGRNDD